MKAFKHHVARIRALLQPTPADSEPREGGSKYSPARYAYLENAGMARAAQRL